MKIRDMYFDDDYEIEPLKNIKVDDIRNNPKYAHYAWRTRNGESFTYNSEKIVSLRVIKDFDVIYISDEKEMIWINAMARCNVRDAIEAELNKVRALERRRDSKKYLNSSFAKGWLRKMQYTVKESETGEKYLFLAILPGYGKLSKTAFTNICKAIYYTNFDDEFCMTMWIGGKVNWTMFYSQPFTHVNGHETYFCGGVAKDSYSPDDWERDMSDLKAKLGHPVSQKEYIDFLFKKER